MLDFNPLERLIYRTTRRFVGDGKMETYVDLVTIQSQRTYLPSGVELHLNRSQLRRLSEPQRRGRAQRLDESRRRDDLLIE